MPSRRVGGLAVGAVGLGALPLSVEGRPSRERAVATIHAALDAGVTLVDTADCYSLGPHDVGHNERLVADALAAYGAADVVVATKGGQHRPSDGSWQTDGRPERVRAACEASLRALRTDAIALYQLHRPDPAVPFAESVGAVRDLRDEGKVRLVGVSNVTVEQLDEARAVVDVASVQNRFAPDHLDGLPVLRRCAAYGIAFLPWAPLGGLGRRGRLASNAAAFERVARDRAVSVQRVCLAWHLAQAGVVVPIPGTTRPEAARDNAAAADLELTADELVLLGAAATARPGGGDA